MTIKPRTETKVFQILESLEADFEKMTWTFGLGTTTEVGAGQYAILTSEQYAEMSARMATAQGLLRQWLGGHLDDGFRGRVERFFDPAPL